MTDFTNVSDEELLNMAEPPQEPVVEVQQSEEITTEKVPEASTPDNFQESQNQVEEEPDDSDAPESEEREEQDSGVDYKAFYERLTQPFKANGREFQVTDPQDIITLMQQGANYSKKMAAIKPLTKIGKLLEDNQLMDEGSINYLIDLHNKKPEAIAKLIKDSGIDLYDFDASKGEDYTPTPRHVSDTSIELQSVLDELQQTSETFSKTIQTIADSWDEASRATLAQHPELIRILDSQMQDGTFEKIVHVMEYERLLGRLAGVNTLEAYRTIGERLFSNPANRQQMNVPTSGKPVKSAVDQNRDNMRKAAASPRKVATDAKQQINPLSLSDEEFMNLDLNSIAL